MRGSSRLAELMRTKELTAKNLQECLEDGADINYVYDNTSPLLLACTGVGYSSSFKNKLLDFLLAHPDTNVNQCVKMQVPLTVLLTMHPMIDVKEYISAFYRKNVDFNLLDGQGLAALHRVIIGNIVRGTSQLEALIRYGADLEIKNARGETPLFYYARVGKVGENRALPFIAMLIKFGANVLNKPSPDSPDLISLVAMIRPDGEEALKQTLLDDIRMRMPDDPRSSPLRAEFMSAGAGAGAGAGATVSAASRSIPKVLTTPAARIAQLDLLELCATVPGKPSRLTREAIDECLAKGASLNYATYPPCPRGDSLYTLFTPLTYVLKYSTSDSDLSLLLQHPSINVNAEIEYHPPLYIVLYRGLDDPINAKFFDLLLRNGANPNLLDASERSVVEALDSAHAHWIGPLVRCGANIRGKDAMSAWRGCSRSFAKLRALLVCGANVNDVIDDAGGTPILYVLKGCVSELYATKEEAIQALSLMIAMGADITVNLLEPCHVFKMSDYFRAQSGMMPPTKAYKNPQALFDDFKTSCSAEEQAFLDEIIKNPVHKALVAIRTEMAQLQRKFQAEAGGPPTPGVARVFPAGAGAASGAEEPEPSRCILA